MTLFSEKLPDRKNDGRTDPILLDPFGYRWGSKQLLQTKFLWSQIICRALIIITSQEFCYSTPETFK